MRTQGAPAVVQAQEPAHGHSNDSTDARRDRIARLMATAAVRAATHEPESDGNAQRNPSDRRHPSPSSRAGGPRNGSRGSGDAPGAASVAKAGPEGPLVLVAAGSS